MIIKMIDFFGMIGYYMHFCGRSFGFGSLCDLIDLERHSSSGLIIV